MEKKAPPIKWILFAFLILIGAIGFGTASFIFKANLYVARGALGFAVIYLLSREIDFRNNGESIEILGKFPKNIKYILLVFGLSLVFYWGLNEVLELIFFVIRSLSSSGGP